MTTATELMLRLVDFAVARNLVAPIDRPEALNRLLEIMGMDAPRGRKLNTSPRRFPKPPRAIWSCAPSPVSAASSRTAASAGICSPPLMGALTPSPAEVRA